MSPPVRWQRASRAWVVLLGAAAALPACGASLADRLSGHLHDRDPGRGEPRLEVKEGKELSLGGLRLVTARDRAGRHGTQRCVVSPKHLWCGERDQALTEIVRTFQLGPHPERLPEAEWLALIIHVLDIEGVVHDPAAEDVVNLTHRLGRPAPPSARAAPGGGVVVELVHRVGPADAARGLERITVIVRPDGTIRHARSPM